METNGLTEHSESLRKKQRRGRDKQNDGQLVTERDQDFNLAFRDTKKRRVMGALALLPPIRYTSLFMCCDEIVTEGNICA